MAKYRLYLDLDKSKFIQKKIKYLRFIIIVEVGVILDPKKIRVIAKQEVSQSIKGVYSFLSFTNFYYIFIKNYSIKAAPLTILTGKGAPFKWKLEYQKAFESLKGAFSKALVLTQQDLNKKTFLKADYSGQGLGGILSYKVNSIFKLVAFYSYKLTAPKYNYLITDKEILAIVDYL